jgi:hypothetical protein
LSFFGLVGYALSFFGPERLCFELFLVWHVYALSFFGLVGYALSFFGPVRLCFEIFWSGTVML